MTSAPVFADPKQMLHSYLDRQRDALVWKLKGLSARDSRWPMTPTGTNLLGLIKHLGAMEYGYFGDVFGRPPAEPIESLAPGAPVNADMWATADESCESVLAFYARACAHADQTIATLDLDAPGFVPWWHEERRNTSLHHVLTHMIAETARHAGHADIVRELIDGETGLYDSAPNIPDGGEINWGAYVANLRDIAQQASEAAGA